MTEMGRILALVEIGRAAVEVDRVREQAAEARAQRDGLLCECESDDRPPDIPRGGPPCWKHYEEGCDYDGDGVPEPWRELLDVAEWCDNCLKRQVAHKSYVELRNKLGGMRAGLARRCTHYRERSD